MDLLVFFLWLIETLNRQMRISPKHEQFIELPQMDTAPSAETPQSRLRKKAPRDKVCLDAANYNMKKDLTAVHVCVCSDWIPEPSALNKCFIPAHGDAACVQGPIFPAAPPGGSTRRAFLLAASLTHIFSSIKLHIRGKSPLSSPAKNNAHKVLEKEHVRFHLLCRNEIK